MLTKRTEVLYQYVLPRDAGTDKWSRRRSVFRSALAPQAMRADYRLLLTFRPPETFLIRRAFKR